MNDSSNTPASNQIELAKIKLNDGTQPREYINAGTVGEYIADIKAGDVFPPIDLFYDGKTYRLGHGFHRLYAHRGVGHKTIEAIVHPGTKEDAQWFSFAANREQDHVGLRRTHGDKQRAIQA